MLHFIATGGPFMWPILLLGILALALTAARVAGVATGAGRGGAAAARTNTVLHLGIAAFVLGVTAQLTGLYQAAQAIMRAGDVSPQLVAGGVLVSFNTTLLGLYVLFVALVLWLGLRFLLPAGGEPQ